MCQDLGKCIGQSGLILLIKDGSRADAGGCSLTPGDVTARCRALACAFGDQPEPRVVPWGSPAPLQPDKCNPEMAWQ
jgi:hypothetical protein